MTKFLTDTIKIFIVFLVVVIIFEVLFLKTPLTSHFIIHKLAEAFLFAVVLVSIKRLRLAKG